MRKESPEMNYSFKNLLFSAAAAGLLTGTAVCAHASTTQNTNAQLNTQSSNSALYTQTSKDKHSCKGQNSCKGKGGCKSSDNGCKGKNSCKGKGGCATNGHKMPSAH